MLKACRYVNVYKLRDRQTIYLITQNNVNTNALNVKCNVRFAKPADKQSVKQIVQYAFGSRRIPEVHP